jgi:hypothetical protein
LLRRRLAAHSDLCADAITVIVMKLSTNDDAVLGRRIVAVQLGLLLALLLSALGQRYGLPTTLAAQLTVMVAGIAIALAIERALRPDCPSASVQHRSATVDPRPKDGPSHRPKARHAMHSAASSVGPAARRR